MDDDGHISKRFKVTHNYNRCRKLLQKGDKKQCSAKNLRNATSNQVEKFNKIFSISPPLSTDDKLCYKCREFVNKECESSKESSQGTFDSPEVNVNILENCGSEESSVNAIPIEFDSNETVLNYFNSLVENMKIKFHHEDTTKDEKIQILSLIPLSWKWVEIKKIFNATDHMIRVARKLQTINGPMSKPDAKRGKPLSKQVENAVITFYKSEDNTYILPGLKETVRIKNDEGEIRIEPKQLILCTLKELFVLFKTDKPEISISFSTFAKLRPKACILAGGNGTHAVCICSIHQNVKLAISGCLNSLTQGYMLHIKDYKLVMSYIICKENVYGDLSKMSEDCFMGRCKKCPGIGKLRDYLTTVFEDNDVDEVTISQWLSQPVTTLETIVLDQSSFIENFCDKVQILLPHAFIAKQQSMFFKQLKLSLTPGKIAVSLDFSENYAFVVQNAPPGFHWNNNQATIFVISYHWHNGNEISQRGFVVVSDCLTHDAVAVYTYIKLFIEFLHTTDIDVQHIDYVSDGAPQQFKNYKNVLNIYHHEDDFKIPVTWHFFPTAHGKGACDGIGGSVKRATAKASLRLPPEKQILTAHSMYEWLKNNGNYKTVDFAFSPQTEYNKNLRKLNKRFSTKKRVEHLREKHFIKPVKDKKKVSCKDHSASTNKKDFVVKD